MASVFKIPETSQSVAELHFAACFCLRRKVKTIFSNSLWKDWADSHKRGTNRKGYGASDFEGNSPAGVGTWILNVTLFFQNKPHFLKRTYRENICKIPQICSFLQRKLSDYQKSFLSSVLPFLLCKTLPQYICCWWFVGLFSSLVLSIYPLTDVQMCKYGHFYFSLQALQCTEVSWPWRLPHWIPCYGHVCSDAPLEFPPTWVQVSGASCWKSLCEHSIWCMTVNSKACKAAGHSLHQFSYSATKIGSAKALCGAVLHKTLVIRSSTCVLGFQQQQCKR